MISSNTHLKLKYYIKIIHTRLQAGYSMVFMSILKILLGIA